MPLVVVEAKKEGLSFEFPSGLSTKNLRLDGAIMTDKPVKEAIIQVRKYCDDAGIKFAIATNGYAWIIFRAIRDDIPWRKGHVLVFPSSDFLINNFTQFWNILSYQAICNGSLDSEFSGITSPSRKLYRVIDNLFNSDLPLRRNRLNSQLQPLIEYIFEDIAAQNDIDLFQSCYVHTGSLKIVADDLNVVITDTIPKNVVFEGTKPLKQTEEDAGEFGALVEKAVRERKGELYLLLGGIGSGKTTFLKRYTKIIATDLLEKNTYTFVLNLITGTHRRS